MLKKTNKLLISLSVLCGTLGVLGVVNLICLVYRFFKFPKMSEPLNYFDILSNGTAMYRPDFSTVLFSAITAIVMILLSVIFAVKLAKKKSKGE